MELETQRTILRHWRICDAKELYKYASNPNVGPIAGWPIHNSVKESREIIKSVFKKPYTFAVVLKETEEPVGCAGLIFGKACHIDIPNNEAEIGYWIGEPYWGQGLIPEAVNKLLEYSFDELKLNRIWCGYFDGNTKSKRVAEKCGFQYQFTKENVPCAIEGQLNTVHFMSITKDEWLRGKK